MKFKKIIGNTWKLKINDLVFTGTWDELQDRLVALGGFL